MNHGVRAAAALAALGVRLGLRLGLGLGLGLVLGRIGVGVGVGVGLRQPRDEFIEAGERAWVVVGARLRLERRQRLGARIEGGEAGAAKA